MLINVCLLQTFYCLKYTLQLYIKNYNVGIILSQQRGGLLVGDVPETPAHQPPGLCLDNIDTVWTWIFRYPPVPGVDGRAHAGAALCPQLLPPLHPVHHVEVAHLVLSSRPNLK